MILHWLPIYDNFGALSVQFDATVICPFFLKIGSLLAVICPFFLKVGSL